MVASNNGIYNITTMGEFLIVFLVVITLFMANAIFASDNHRVNPR